MPASSSSRAPDMDYSSSTRSDREGPDGRDGDDETDGDAGGPQRKRVRLACQFCKRRKIRCDGDPKGCETCREQGSTCEYLPTGLKRGPRKGFKLRQQQQQPGQALPHPSPPFASTSTSSSSRPHLQSYSQGDISLAPLPGTSSSPTFSNHRRSSHNSHSHRDGDHRRYSHLTNPSPLNSFSSPLLDTSTSRRPPSDLGSHPPNTQSLNDLAGFAIAQERDLYGVSGSGSGPGSGIGITLENGERSAKERLGVEDILGTINAATPKEVDLDMSTQEGLLGVYFTHIHNVWPLIYKPTFHASTVSKTVLLAMLAAAAVLPISSTPLVSPETADALFLQAQQRLTTFSSTTKDPDIGAGGGQYELRPVRSSLATVQALILFTLRQTSKGHKSSAYLWACKAFGMALELGLHRAVGGGGAKRISPAESETRSRVFWCCYVLDKSFSEETGRPFILRARTATVPLPSITEMDEFELWPPPSASLGAISPLTSKNVRPVRSRTISCFNSTCRLGFLVEQILELDPDIYCAVAVGGPEAQIWERDEESLKEEEEARDRQRAKLVKKLNDWYEKMDADLKVDVQARFCPPTHFVVNLSWYHSAAILLHSQNMSSKPDGTGVPGLYGTSHQICSNAAESIVALLSCLDRFKVLAASSSDVLHMLSHAALFHAYNSALPNADQASNAEVNFQQCCLWLKEIGSFWAPASAHRQFFDGLVKGGTELAAINRRGPKASNSRVPTPDPGSSPRMNGNAMPTSFARESRESPEAGFVMDPQLEPLPEPNSIIINPPPVTDIFRARSHFWNELVPNVGTSRTSGNQAMLANQQQNFTPTTASMPTTTPYPTTTQSGMNATLMSAAEAQANEFSEYLNSLDPSDPADMLVQYMLESIPN